MELKSILIGAGLGLLIAGAVYLASKNAAASVAEAEPKATSFYQNDEKMTITRDANGYIKSTSIKRNATGS